MDIEKKNPLGECSKLLRVECTGQGVFVTLTLR